MEKNESSDFALPRRMPPAPFRPAFIKLNVEWAFVWGHYSRVAQAAKRTTEANQLSV